MSPRRTRPDRQQRELLAELAQLYREVDERFATHRCDRSTECCRFGLTGREPYVTSLELLAVERAQARSGGPLPARRRAPRLDPGGADEATCPLLGRDGRCSVYDVRPFGCRTFWCQRATSLGAVKHRELSKLVRALQALAARHVPGGDAGRPLRRALARSAPRR